MRLAIRFGSVAAVVFESVRISVQPHAFLAETLENFNKRMYTDFMKRAGPLRAWVW